MSISSIDPGPGGAGMNPMVPPNRLPYVSNQWSPEPQPMGKLSSFELYHTVYVRTQSIDVMYSNYIAILCHEMLSIAQLLAKVVLAMAGVV